MHGEQEETSDDEEDDNTPNNEHDENANGGSEVSERRRLTALATSPTSGQLLRIALHRCNDAANDVGDNEIVVECALVASTAARCALLAPTLTVIEKDVCDCLRCALFRCCFDSLVDE